MGARGGVRIVVTASVASNSPDNCPVGSSSHADTYLSKLRRDSIGADFQSVRKLTNYVCAKPLESPLRLFSNNYKQSGYICNFPYIRG